MYYMKYLPHSSLQDYVECYWTMHNLGSGSRVEAEQVVADIGIELFFNFGAPYRRSECAEPATVSTVAGSHLVGLRTRSIIVSQSGHIHIFGVRFRPWGLSLLLKRLPLSEITHRTHTLEELFPRPWRELEERLRDSDGDEERVCRIDAFLIAAFSQTTLEESLSAKSAAIITASGGEAAIGTLCSSMGVSYKRLERSFLREVGVTPKLYSRILRFQRTASHIAASAQNRQTLPDGYYDQSHFIREFASFAGESPRRFFARQQRISGYLLEQDRTSKIYNTGPDDR